MLNMLWKVFFKTFDVFKTTCDAKNMKVYFSLLIKSKESRKYIFLFLSDLIFSFTHFIWLAVIFVAIFPIWNLTISWAIKHTRTSRALLLGIALAHFTVICHLRVIIFSNINHFRLACVDENFRLIIWREKNEFLMKKRFSFFFFEMMIFKHARAKRKRKIILKIKNLWEYFTKLQSYKVSHRAWEHENAINFFVKIINMWLFRSSSEIFAIT